MRVDFRALAIIAAAGLVGAGAASVRAGVFVSEVMYHPPQGEQLEYVELENPSGAVVDVSGWALTGGIRFVFPESTLVGAGERLLVLRSAEEFLEAHPSVDPSIVVGEYGGGLSNGGDRFELLDSTAALIDSVAYDDDSPWDFLADGEGPSLERVCGSAPGHLPESWRSGAGPVGPGEPAGSPGRPGIPPECPPEPPVRPPVFLSEILYHAVLEESIEERHEFVEIHNASDEPVSLAGWRLAGGVEFEFPADAEIAPGGYRVIARDRAALASVEAWELTEADLLGDYDRTLSNRGEKVMLLAADGQGVDSVTYSDRFPWPVAADAMGAGQSWLPESRLPLSRHRHMGHSLERVSFTAPTGHFTSWDVSPLDGATPGRENASARSAPVPAVDDLLVVQRGEALDGPIRPGKETLVQVRFAPYASEGEVALEWFVDDLAVADETIERAVLFDDGIHGGDTFPDDGVFTTTLPAQDAHSVVRYRVNADRGSGPELVSPRPSHPNPWHAYFVESPVATETRTYHILISPAQWGRMWTNIQGGRVSGCNPHPRWNDRVDAVLVHDGVVRDAHVRYQGSRWNRANGRNLSRWTGARPVGGPNPVRALSWRIALPRYAQLEERSVLVLNKLNQGCPGYNAGVGYRLFAEADLPSPLTRFVRLHINGEYYHYMMEYERPGEEMLERYHAEMAVKHPEWPRETVGHLFKSVGCNCDEGPYGWGDARALSARCGFTREERYAWTYDRKTHTWDSNAAFVELIDGLHTARRGGVDALRSYFEEFFDLDLLLSYLAIINYSVPFDDMFQNHFFYQRTSDGKWCLAPWDLDRNFGEWKGATASIWVGRQGDADNRSGWWNYLKDAFFRAYPEEFQDRLLLLNNTLLHPDHIAELVDQVTAESNPAEAAAAPSGVACSFPARASSLKSFATQRFSYINRFVAGVSVDAGPDVTVYAGTEARFDATASTPPPGPDVVYTWDLGMEGAEPTHTFREPGEHIVTLTIEVRGVPLTDSVLVQVLPLPPEAWVTREGRVVIEAERPSSQDLHGEEEVSWEVGSTLEGYSGDAYLEARSERRRTFTSRHRDRSPEVRYAILFEEPGEYRVWLRGFSASTSADTCHVGLDAVERTSNQAHQFVVDETAFRWSGESRRDGPQVLQVSTAGLHFLSVWVRESGQVVDKIILTRDLEFEPEGLGPPESDREPTGGARVPFVRGDVGGNGTVAIDDAIAILDWLFRGGRVLTCEDHGDVNDDGGVNLTDAVALLNFLFLGGEPPAAPFPGAGADPTPDGAACGDG